MKYVSAAVSFIFVFIGVFFVSGWLLMPYLPPVPDRPIWAFEWEYWTDNWIGVLLGIVLGGLSARSVLKKAKREEQKEPKKALEAMR